MVEVVLWRPLKTVVSCDLFIIRECVSTLYVGLAHVVPPTNTKFKLLLLPTQAGIQTLTIFQVYTHIYGSS